MNYVRLHEVSDPTLLSIIKSSLASEDIDYRIQFEHASADPGISGRSGTQIEVNEEQLEAAIDALKVAGVDIARDPVEDRFLFIDRFAKLSKNWPILGELAPGERLLTVLVIGVLLLSVIGLGMYSSVIGL